MTPLEEIRGRLGVFYSDPVKDAEIEQMIGGAELYFKGAGWEFDPTPTPLQIEAVALFCKMAQSTDPSLLTNHPVLISFIAQGRASNA